MRVHDWKLSVFLLQCPAVSYVHIIAERLSCILESQNITHHLFMLRLAIGTPFSLRIPERNIFPGNFGKQTYKMAVSCLEGIETQVFKSVMIPNGNLMSLQ